jgi:[acyl-carrier-protein] S-malonyltransferase
MGRAWVNHPSWEVVAEASQIAGRDLSRLLLDAEQEELTRTANAQLATFVLSLVVLDAIERLGLAPTMCAGHSLGEYTALVASGALGFEDGIQLVVERGEAMHDAAEQRPGTMVALLGATDEVAEKACKEAGGEVWVANYNAPGQVVLAGSIEAVPVAAALAKDLGARKVIPFPVAGAFHTSLMASARPRLRKALAAAAMVAPEIPVVANVDARPHETAAEWMGLLSAQLCSPVRWRQSLEAMAEMGAIRVIEVGPGGVLTGLAKRTLPDVLALGVAVPDDLDALVEAVADSDTWHAYSAAHQGEHLYGSERVVVAPASGIFEPESTLEVPGPGDLHDSTGGNVAGGTEVAVGDLVGMVGETEVRTPFAGRVVGLMAHAGERVVNGQPVAWLHVTDNDSTGSDR